MKWQAMSLVLVAAGCGVVLGGAPQGGQAADTAQVKHVKYTGNIHGAPAVALVSYEPLPNFTVMAGEVRSNGFLYTFTANLVGSSGYGNVLDHQQNTTIQVRIDVTQNGFTVTTNPFGPGTPTVYYFKKL
jgi:hypothetical protein